ncbi:MAG: EAL domain-containing protein, partial [Pseudomonadales bacterium]
FDVIKMDKSFVDDLEDSSDARSVVQAIVALADALDKELVAEGVQTEGQRSILAQLGCEIGQGLLFSKALPPQALIAFLSQGDQIKRGVADGD